MIVNEDGLKRILDKTFTKIEKAIDEAKNTEVVTIHNHSTHDTTTIIDGYEDYSIVDNDLINIKSISIGGPYINLARTANDNNMDSNISVIDMEHILTKKADAIFASYNVQSNTMYTCLFQIATNDSRTISDISTLIRIKDSNKENILGGFTGYTSPEYSIVSFDFDTKVNNKVYIEFINGSDQFLKVKNFRMFKSVPNFTRLKPYYCNGPILNLGLKNTDQILFNDGITWDFTTLAIENDIPLYLLNSTTYDEIRSDGCFIKRVERMDYSSIDMGNIVVTAQEDGCAEGYKKCKIRPEFAINYFNRYKECNISIYKDESLEGNIPYYNKEDIYDQEIEGFYIENDSIYLQVKTESDIITWFRDPNHYIFYAIKQPSITEGYVSKLSGLNMITSIRELYCPISIKISTPSDNISILPRNYNTIISTLNSYINNLSSKIAVFDDKDMLELFETNMFYTDDEDGE